MATALRVSLWSFCDAHLWYELLYSQKCSHWIRVLRYYCLLLSASMGTAIEQLPVKDRLSQQSRQSQGCFFTCARAILEYDAYDVLLKCVLLGNNKRLCWTLQVVEWGNVLVYTNDMLQCLHPLLCPEMHGNEIHALYYKDQKESYSLFSISF